MAGVSVVRMIVDKTSENGTDNSTGDWWYWDGDGKLVFSLCVSYPESDLSSPFLLTIGPDGSATITKDEFMDVEPDDAP